MNRNPRPGDLIKLPEEEDNDWDDYGLVLSAPYVSKHTDRNGNSGYNITILWMKRHAMYPELPFDEHWHRDSSEYETWTLVAETATEE